jgi:hypothetical protein
MGDIVPREPIELDRERWLVYDFAALHELKAAGLDVFKQVDNLKELLQDVDALSAFVWAGLIRDDPALTLADVYGLLYLGNMAYATERAAVAFAASTQRRKVAASPRRRKVEAAVAEVVEGEAPGGPESPPTG